VIIFFPVLFLAKLGAVARIAFRASEKVLNLQLFAAFLIHAPTDLRGLLELALQVSEAIARDLAGQEARSSKFGFGNIMMVVHY